MIIHKAELQGSCLVLSVPPADAMRWLYGFKEDKDYEIQPAVKKRSRSANAYAWQLITQLSSVLNVPKEEIYAHAIENIGGLTDSLIMQANAVKDFEKRFVNNHLGRKVEIIGQLADRVEVLVTYGSSDYDSRQMSQLIDSLTQDCRALGIETLEDMKIQALIDDWEKQWQQ